MVQDKVETFKVLINVSDLVWINLYNIGNGYNSL